MYVTSSTTHLIPHHTPSLEPSPPQIYDIHQNHQHHNSSIHCSQHQVESSISLSHHPSPINLQTSLRSAQLYTIYKPNLRKIINRKLQGRCRARPQARTRVTQVPVQKHHQWMRAPSGRTPRSGLEEIQSGKSGRLGNRGTRSRRTGRTDRRLIRVSHHL